MQDASLKLKMFMENEACSCRLSPHFDTLTSKTFADNRAFTSAKDS